MSNFTDSAHVKFYSAGAVISLGSGVNLVVLSVGAMPVGRRGRAIQPPESIKKMAASAVQGIYGGSPPASRMAIIRSRLKAVQ